jgi:hypothetical protein
LINSLNAMRKFVRRLHCQKYSRKTFLKPTIGNEFVHKIINYNGVRVVDFATSKSRIVKCALFPHCNIHKYTWTSPDENTHSQIDHILING